MNTVFITGGNRGIGLEFCRQYAQAGWRVIASCRNPDQAQALQALAERYLNLNIICLDMTDRAAIEIVGQQLAGKPIDLLIANAGIYGDRRGFGLGSLDYDAWTESFEINVMGVIKTIECLLPNLKQSRHARIAALSSQMGSIEDNSSGGCYLYRTSKAALNAAMKSVAIDLQGDGISVAIFHPGWVKTDMGGPHALIDSQQSVAGMIEQIEALSLEQTGQFIKYDGSRLPW